MHMEQKKRVIALGFFDGVHLGHQALLRRTAERAEMLGLSPALLTFDRSPREFVTGTPVPLLTTVQERSRTARALFPGMEVITVPFDRAMMTMPWEDFVVMLSEVYRARWLVAGHDFRFGHRNSGTAALLREKAAELWEEPGGTPEPDFDTDGNLQGLRFLAAEDNEINAEILVELLDIEGASCEVVENGRLAVERFQTSAAGEFDAILMDVQMPVMNGHDAARAIRALPRSDAGIIPIIAMTANAFAEDEKAALDAGIPAPVAGVVNFNCLYRTLEILSEQQVEPYCALFGRYPSIGFSTAGEAFLGHINETSTILVIK